MRKHLANICSGNHSAAGRSGGRMAYPCLRETLALLVLAAVTFLIYSNTFHSPFILDDWRSIEDNSHIRLIDFSVDSLRDVLLESPLAVRPVANISFALNYYFHQYQLPGYHFVNIVIHLLAGVLLYLFGRALLNTPALRNRYRSPSRLAFIAALVWLVLPLHVQSVTYLVQRMNSLAAMFCLLSLLLYAQARFAVGLKKKTFLFSGSSVAAVLAFGSKEIAATLPGLVFFLEWYFFQDLDRRWLKRYRNFWGGLICLFLGGLLVYFDGHPLDGILGTYGIRDFSLAERVMTEARVVVFYLTLLFFPHPSRLNLEHYFSLSTSLLNPSATILALTMLAVLLGIAIGLARRERLLSFAILWWMGNLAIESSVIGLELVFEHRTYLPSMMIILSAVVWLHGLIRPQWLKAVLLCGIVLAGSFWTYERNSVWQDEVTLYRDCFEKSPGKLRARTSLAYALSRQGRFSEATFHLSEALRYEKIGNLDEVQIRNNLGQNYLYQEDFDAAAEQFARALLIKPDNALVATNMGLALARQEKLEMADYFFREAIRIDPDYAPAYNNMGVLLLRQKKYDQALHHFEEALRLNPYFIEARKNIQIVPRKPGIRR